MKFRKRPQPVIHETLEYDPDLQTIKEIREGILQLDSLLIQKRVTQKQYENELRLFANSIAKLEEKYGDPVHL